MLLNVLQTSLGHTKSTSCPMNMFFITLGSTCIWCEREGRRSLLMATRTTLLQVLFQTGTYDNQAFMALVLV